MQTKLKIAIWNANGLANHKLEVEHFLFSHQIDIFLISETHFCNKSFFKIKNYDLVFANHPSNKAHGGAAILIRNKIKYEILEAISENSMQAAVVKIKCNNFNVVIASIYLPPRFQVKCDDFKNFFSSLGHKFIVGGDYNAKHPWWGSRIANPKGKELYKCIKENHYSVISTGTPTYWPSDPKKIPDLLDFAVIGGISANFLSAQESTELSSDHSPVLINYNTYLQSVEYKLKLTSPLTNVPLFHSHINKNLETNIPLRTNEQIDKAVEDFITIVHDAAAKATATPHNAKTGQQINNFSPEIDNLVRNKRNLRKIWQQTHHPLDKRNYNKAAKELKFKLYQYKNECLGNYLVNLGATKDSEYSLWKATKYIKRPKQRNIPIKDEAGAWCRSNLDKAEAFASYLQQTFKPLSISQNTYEINSFLDAPCQMDFPIHSFSTSEIQDEISKLSTKKTPGYDGIDARTMKILPKKCIHFLLILFNSVLRIQYYPIQWKCAEIIMIAKPNKPENEVTSYRPISLLSTVSKIFERIFLKRLLPLLESRNIIPDHQFGFRKQHGTIEQCHRIVKYISSALETKKYCVGVFLDIEKAFDKVWHDGLLYKIKKWLPYPYYFLIKSYLTDRTFYVKAGDASSRICEIKSGIPQGSVLGPVLYTIFTADIELSEEVLIGTYADDTAILASHRSVAVAYTSVQRSLNAIEEWLQKWNMSVNAQKSIHVTFTLNRGSSPKLKINNHEIPEHDKVGYLGMHLDKRMTWRVHVSSFRKKLNNKIKKMYWLLGPKSQLSTHNKLLIYKCIIKPVWTYGIQLWGACSASNMKIIERFQSKALRMIVNAPWFVTNSNILKDLEVPRVLDVVNTMSDRYLERISYHTNTLAICLLDETNATYRLKRHNVLDLPFRK